MNNNSAETPHYQPYQANWRAAFTFVLLALILSFLSPLFPYTAAASRMYRILHRSISIDHTLDSRYSWEIRFVNSFPAIGHVIWHAREPTFKPRIPHASDRRFTWIHDGAYRPPVGSNNRLVAGAEKNRRGWACQLSNRLVNQPPYEIRISNRGTAPRSLIFHTENFVTDCGATRCVNFLVAVRSALLHFPRL